MNWKTLKSLSLSSTIEWAADQPWAIAMADCPQDPRWHAEGDVWTHTKMVCKQLERLEDWSELDANDQRILIMTALLHDVAKPLTMEIDPESGAISTPGHAVKGEGIARGVLRKLECDLKTREHIAKLVRYHGKPVFATKKSRPENEVIKLSWLLNNELLYLFALADKRGRISESQSRPEDNLHFWKLIAREHHCFRRRYEFASDHQRLVWLHSDPPNLQYVPYEDFRCTVTMMSGLPGSGKDTWIRSHCPGLPVVSLDQIRRELNVDPGDNQGVVAQKAKDRCREHLRAKRDFVFNATNTMSLTRARWLKLFEQYDARIRIVYLEPAWTLLLKQNRDRKCQVPEEVVQRLADKLQPPTSLECHELVCN